jgi:hypothetical protein
LQTAQDEGGEPIGLEYFAPPAKPMPVEPKAEPASRRPTARATPPPRPVEPEPTPAHVFEPVGAEEFQARLKANPDDHEARLNLARVWWASADRDQSLKLYQELIEADKFLPEVAADLQRNLETFENSDWFRALGDAHMKLGNLARALDAYRGALANL